MNQNMKININQNMKININQNMKQNIFKVLTIVVLMLTSIGAWAGTVIVKEVDGGSVKASQAAAGATCTLTATPDAGYYLKALTAVVTLDGGAVQAPGNRASGINIDESTVQITASNPNADPSGETTHTFTMPTDENFNVEVTAVFEARISIANAVITLAEGTYTYDGTEKKPSVSSVVVGETTLDASEYDVTYSENINAGSAATVKVTGKRTCTGEATKTFTIGKAAIEPTVTLEGWNFGAEANTPAVDGNPGKGAVTYTYKAAGAEAFSETVPTAAGTHTVKATIAETDNYQAGEATSTFTIAKAAIEPTVTLEGWNYGAEANTPVVEGNPGSGAVTYTYKAAGAEAFTETVPTAAGTHTVKATIAETDNYQAGEATSTFTIAKAAIEPTVTLEGWNFGSEPNKPSVDGNPGKGTETFLYKEKDAADDTYTETVPEAVGTYTVKVTVGETDNYLSGSATADFTISNRVLDLSEIVFKNHWVTYYSEEGNGDVDLPANSNVGAYVASAVSENTVTVTQISFIPEGVPVLLNDETTATTDFIDYEVNLLMHADEAIEVTDDGLGSYYGLYNGAMMRVTGTIPAGKNYLFVEVPQASKLNIVFDNDSNMTGIEKVENNQTNGGEWYSIDGQKLQNQPTKKGLYIRNGRKVIVNK